MTVLKRRQFLKNSIFLTGGSALFSGFTMAQEYKCELMRLPGVQLFAVRDALDEDIAGTLAGLAEIGVREVELFGLTSAETLFGIPLEDLKLQLDENGLSMSCAHMDTADDNVAGISRSAKALGVKTVILPIGLDFLQVTGRGLRIQGPQSLQAVEQLGDLMNRLGREFAEQDLAFAYHNHHVEFFDVEGQIPFDYLMAYTDSGLVKVELDVGWLALANVNYLDYLERYGSRVVSVHLKDFNGSKPDDMGDFLGAAANLVPPGSGVMDFQGVLQHMDTYGINHGFVEIDMAPEPFEAISSGIQHLQMLRPC